MAADEQRGSGGARPRARRRADTLARLDTVPLDGWVATADGTGAVHLVPLSVAWVDGTVVLAVHGASRTARNLRASGRARIGLGPTRDVVMLDVILDRDVPVETDDLLHGAYVARSDWDPRDGQGYVFCVLRPERVQAWREADEIAGRTLMRDGTWLV